MFFTYIYVFEIVDSDFGSLSILLCLMRHCKIKIVYMLTSFFRELKQ